MSWKAIGLLLLFYMGAASGASVYKWVDEEGNVHFSEGPPPTEHAIAEEVEVTASKSGIQPEMHRGRLKCGDLELHQFEEAPAERIYRLEGNVEEWEKRIESERKSRLESAKQAIHYRGSGGFGGSDTRIAEYQCAIDWAKGELKTLSPEREKIAGRVDDVEKAINEVEQQRIARCGVDNRTGMVEVNEQYRAYKRCIEPFDRELDKLRGVLARAKKDRDRVAPY